MSHPYSDLNDYNFWFRSMTSPAPGHIDPVIDYKIIRTNEKISTMGSCFAQHLSKNIKKLGFNYYVTESAPQELSEDDAFVRGYGIFTARYGNIYTARQALQLLDRAYDFESFGENIWLKDDYYVDAYRPKIELSGFSNKESLLQSRISHLSCVRKMFEESDWLIFTLGLTEAWRSRVDGSIFPIAPGVYGGQFDEEKYEFVNFTITEVISDLRKLFNKLSAINPRLRIILTVSPVPLIATYEDRHVLVSTVVSKSVLRVAADELEKEYENVNYFPSYELITSPANGGKYYCDDLRQVSDIGVNHVMRVFSKHFLGRSPETERGSYIKYSPSGKEDESVVCDEEEIENAIRRSGF